MSKVRRIIRAAGPLAAILLVAAGCSAPRAAAPSVSPAASGTTTAVPSFEGKSLNIVTGGTGGVYIVYGAGLADVLSKQLKVSASPQQTTASVDNMKFIGQGKADLAFALADTAFDAVQGKAPQFTEKVDAKTLAVLYYNFTHLVTKDSSGIAKVADLKGKRVSMGSAGSGTEIIGNRTLEAYGLSPETDIQRERLGVADSANALRDGKIDAFFWSGGLPTAAVLDVANSVKLRFVDLSEGVKKMADKYGPFYTQSKIPAGTYKDNPDVPVSIVANLLVVNAKFDPALARAILTTMFDNQPQLAAIHGEAKNLKLETAIVGSPIDFHPGAIDFYKSKGVWKQ
jgi:TRAP transporter TAXI family solute receptor